MACSLSLRAFNCSAPPCCFPRAKYLFAFASNADSGLYHGWVVAYDAVTMKQAGAWVSTPNGYQGGIWMSGCGISADADGNLYLSIANGPFDALRRTTGCELQRQHREVEVRTPMV